jgi:dTDP-4-dehydrorhamnose 3,5-epimerase
MKVEHTRLAGVLLLVPQPHVDDRGFFTRTFDSSVAQDAGIEPTSFVQDSQSRSRRGVIRGLHVRAGRGEAKLVRCSSGAVYDVVVDVRPSSPTYLQWEGFHLDDVDHHVLFVPRGCAHGWQALSEPADVCYRIDAEHDPSQDVTIAHDDPALAVAWPLPVTTMSPRDRQAPALRDVLDRLAP